MTDKNPHDVLQKKLAALEALFQARLQDRLRDMGTALKCCLDEPTSKTALATLHRLLHTMAGSAGTFGFVELGLRAHNLEMQANILLANDAIDGVALAPFAEAVQDYLAWSEGNSTVREEVEEQTKFAPVVKNAGVRPIYVVDDDVLLAKDIALQLEYFGFQVIVINHLAQLEPMLIEHPPSAVVMDMMFERDSLAGANELMRLKQARGMDFPSIYISTSNQFEKRLAAVRAGADAYFSKPLDVVALSDRLDVLTARKEAAPYRVLIVDDDTIASDYYCAVLESAGMEVVQLHEPENILNLLGEFDPELVLMDVYMSTCSGIELAKLIRQDNKNLDMPIIFLSSEENMGRQMDAMKFGADEFLVKPIAPEHLVSSIEVRGERCRALRSLITQDSLTLLFNHSAIKEYLGREMSRARRAGTPLSLAMIDLDFFKKVNDTYGHPIGDHVIRALSRLLRQSLRQSDIVGRYGGEEFAVIFPSTSAAKAKTVLDKIRESFMKIRYYGNDTEFSTSFSAGISEMGATEDVEEFFSAADNALYAAKENGRNRIELGGGEGVA